MALASFAVRDHFEKIQLIQQVKLGNHYNDLYLPLCRTEVFEIQKFGSDSRNEGNTQIQQKLSSSAQMSSAIDDKPCEQGKGTSETFFVCL